MKLKEIHRTSTFAWAPIASLPLIATGSVAGALDESFSNESLLEIWAPDFMDKNEFALGQGDVAGPKGLVKDSSRFNRLAWGHANATRPRGVIAAGMENGELAFWDPDSIMQNAGPSSSLILRNTTHTGPVRGLDFNPIQANLLASGAIDGEVYIWDLNDPSKPYSPTPGTRSTKLDEITSVSWNQQVQYVLAGASSTGYTVVWDLRGKREVVALAYGGGAGTLAGQSSVGSGMAVGGRRGMSAIAWHPDNATRLVTASEDDMSPVIMVWDLRNARAPEKILTGHEKGVLSLSWCKQDADLLLSCGKDNRALCWNPQTSEVIGELPSADNWAFQVEWCPRNPDLLATAFFDGTVGIHSIQSTNDATSVASAPKSDGADVFDPGYSRTTQGTLSLKQPPKWLRRPASASFGFGGQLVTVSNLPSAQGKNQSSVVHVRRVVAEGDVIDRVQKLQQAIKDDTLSAFAEEAISQGGEGVEGWKALLSLFRTNSRDELVTLLGYSKEEVASHVEAAIAKLKEQAAANKNSAEDEEGTTGKPHDPVVSFADPDTETETETEATPDASEGQGEAEEEGEGALLSATGVEKTPSEVSASATSDATGGTRLADGESTTTAPSLFGDEHAVGTPQVDAAADFFSTMGLVQNNEQSVVVPHHSYGLDSSVAATIGSRPSSAASENLKSNTFKIFPTDESDTDRLITRALVLGDFESAVALCLSADRFADAILLAIKGGDELLQRTQKTYFERRTTSNPYLRLYQSIVTNDLADIVQNADLQEWQEIFVVICTFAGQEEFANLAEQLGSRLEFQGSITRDSDTTGATQRALELRKIATLTYLAAGRLERLLNVWIDELAEEEKRYLNDQDRQETSRYAAHAHALQTFIEKVTVFRSAVKYNDADLASRAGEDADAKTYKLAALYDRYFEYSDLLASQGLIQEAVSYLQLVPADYRGATIDFAMGKERLLVASGSKATPNPTAVASTSKLPPAPATSGVPATGYSAYPGYAPVTSVPAVQPTPPSGPYAPASTPYGQVQQPYQTNTAPSPYRPAAVDSYAPIQPARSTLLSQGPGHAQPPTTLPPPPSRAPHVGTHAPVPPPKANGGWNDAPAVIDRRTPNPPNVSKPSAITSPFPNASSSGMTSPPNPSSPYMGGGSTGLPPPPRPGSVQGNLPPPPQAGQRVMHPPPPPGMARSPSVPPQPGMGGPPRMASPAQPPPPPGPYAPPSVQRLQQSQQPGGPMPPPGGQFARATPPPGPPRGHAAPPPGPYAPAPQQVGTPMQPPPPGPYGPQGGQPQMDGMGGPPPPPGVGSRQTPVQQQHPLGGLLPPPPGGAGGPPPPGLPGGQGTPAPARASPASRGPPQPKYPAGDRTHIPDPALPIYNILSTQLTRLKQEAPPQRRRQVDDLERRINPLFDALNYETLSQPVVDQLLVLTRAIEARDRDAAMSIHADLLMRGSRTDDIGLWMSGVKHLIMML